MIFTLGTEILLDSSQLLAFSQYDQILVNQLLSFIVYIDRVFLVAMMKYGIKDACFGRELTHITLDRYGQDQV